MVGLTRGKEYPVFGCLWGSCGATDVHRTPSNGGKAALEGIPFLSLVVRQLGITQNDVIGEENRPSPSHSHDIVVGL